MRLGGMRIVLVAMLSACSPFGASAFNCDNDAQCGATGKCMTGFCSFADPTCTSGYRFGDLSGGQSNTCVGDSSTDDGRTSDGKEFLDAHVPMDGVACFGTGFGETCFTTPPSTPVTVDAGAIDTDSSQLCATNVKDNPPWCVIAATDLTIAGAITATGSKPLVLLATGTLAVNGSIDVASHRGGQTGAGSVPLADTTLCDPGTPPGNNGGGAGGSFAKAGGKGGNGGNATPGATKPTNVMRGGCAGQDGKSGTFGTKGLGGGVVYLIGGTKIVVAANINASGASASAGVTGSAGAGGGGSGGLIGLDSPLVTSSAIIFANGGGGAEGSGNTTKGNDGNESNNGAVAAATDGGSNGGGGGAGGATGDATDGTNANTFGGGGGGGGVGAIRLFGATAITGGTTSPPAS